MNENYRLLSDVAIFSELRTDIATVDSTNYISTENMLPNRGGVCEASTLPDVKKLPKYEPKDILLSNIRPYFKKIWYADKVGGCSNDVLVVKAKENIDPQFLYYVLSDNNFFNYSTVTSKGTKMPRGSKHAIMKYLVPNIDKPTQLKIVDILSAYDELIENNNKRIKLLEQMAENLYKEWFVRFRFPNHENTEFENGIPKGWEIEKLFDIANVKYGYAFKSDLFCDDEALNPVVRIRDIPNNKTNTFTSEECDEKYLINENSIVIGMDGIFHMCLWNGGKAFLNQRVVEIESKIDDLSNLHLYYALYPQVKYWEQTISGTTVAHLGDKHLKKMTVLLPSKDICKQADDILSNIMLEKNKLFNQNQNLIKQRDLLLPRLMSGKLEV